MFGKNPIAHKNLGDGTSLRVVAGDGGIFFTIQGEGPFSGHPAVFIRLHGCPLRCFFCDTQFSDPGDPVLEVDQIVDRAIDLWADSPGRERPVGCLQPLAVITGGEPTRQNLGPLIQALRHNNFRVQIETAGIFWQEWMRASKYISPWDVTVVCSPKTPIIDPQVAERVDAYKYVIGPDTEIDPEDGLPLSSTQVEGEVARLARPATSCQPIYLTPMDLYDEVKTRGSYKRVAELSMHYGYIAQLQVHKFMGLP